MKKQLLRLNTFLALKILERRGTKRCFRNWQVHPINVLRKSESEFILFDRLLSDELRFKSYLRMSISTFFKLLDFLKGLNLEFFLDSLLGK